MAEPKIRFKRDDGNNYPDWIVTPFSELSFPSGKKNKNDENLDVYSISNTRGFIPQSEQFEDAGYLNSANRSLYIIVSPGSFAYNPARINVGSIGYQNLKKDVLVSSLYETFNTTDELDDAYLMYWFKTDLFQKNVSKFSEGGVRQYFYYDKLCSVRFSLPCLEEQRKIADFLASVDDLITASEEEVTNLETQKKAVMQKIFSQQVRFKKPDGSDFPDWEVKRLGDFAKRVTRKNNENTCRFPLTISAEYGLIDQYEFFKKTIASKDMSTYYLLQNGEFAYNKSTSKEYPVGTIKRLDRYAVGAVSPLYICFELLGNAVLSDFAIQYFETDKWHQGVLDIAQEGARTHGLLNISVSGFFETVHKLPPDIEEQQLIANFLSDFDEAIAATKKELELWKQLKKALLQQMFV